MIWEIDPVHSRVSFALRVMRLSTTRGRFTVPRGRLSLDDQNPARSWVEAEVEAASIETHNRIRDAHLRSTAFFAATRYPTITFRSTHVEQASDQTYRVTGNLTLRGVTRPVTFNVRHRGQELTLGASMCLSASATINRNDFGIGRGLGVRVAAGALVSIQMEMELVRQSSEAYEVAASTPLERH